jgi:NTP pyrophosphatase (non-canonical NTP hydrolase)
MPMTNNGLSKLTEELGECGQVIGKMLQYPLCQKDRVTTHPDGAGPLPQRLEDEIADVFASAQFVVKKLGLDEEKIWERSKRKLARFEGWDQGIDKVPG